MAWIRRNGGSAGSSTCAGAVARRSVQSSRVPTAETLRRVAERGLVAGEPGFRLRRDEEVAAGRERVERRPDAARPEFDRVVGFGNESSGIDCFEPGVACPRSVGWRGRYRPESGGDPDGRIGTVRGDVPLAERRGARAGGGDLDARRDFGEDDADDAVPGVDRSKAAEVAVPEVFEREEFARAERVGVRNAVRGVKPEAVPIGVRPRPEHERIGRGGHRSTPGRDGGNRDFGAGLGICAVEWLSALCGRGRAWRGIRMVGRAGVRRPTQSRTCGPGLPKTHSRLSAERGAGYRKRDRAEKETRPAATRTASPRGAQSASRSNPPWPHESSLPSTAHAARRARPDLGPLSILSRSIDGSGK
ncbi:hypothetical protein ACFQL4_13525 [Halosimplex aquaticum]